MKVLILDAYNVIHAIPELERELDRSLEAAREALITRCLSLQQGRGDIQEVHIVFDGREDHDQPALQRGSGVLVWFTPRKEEADDRILSMIKKAESRVQFVIVSNDTYVFNNSKAHGARVIGVSEFNNWLHPRPSNLKRVSGTGESKTLTGRQAREINEAYLMDLEQRSVEKKRDSKSKGGQS